MRVLESEALGSLLILGLGLLCRKEAILERLLQAMLEEDVLTTFLLMRIIYGQGRNVHHQKNSHRTSSLQFSRIRLQTVLIHPFIWINLQDMPSGISSTKCQGIKALLELDVAHKEIPNRVKVSKRTLQFDA